MTPRQGRRAGAILPLALTVALVALGGGAGAARADTVTQTRAKLAQIQAQITHEKALRALHQAEATQAYQSFAVAAAAFDQARARLAAIGAQLAALSQQESAARAAWSAESAQAARARLALRATEVGWQEEGVLGPLTVLLSAHSLDDFFARLYLVDQLMAYQGREVLALARATARARAAALSLAHQRAQVLGEEASAQVQAATLERAGSAERAAMAHDQALVSADSGALEQLEEASANLVAVLERERHASTVSPQEGQVALHTIHFIWPVHGPITSPFGMRVDPVTHQYWLHTGIDIGVPEGTPVAAACAGTVLYSGWMTGYGNVVIIDCGSGISTLYAHAESLLVHEGEQVAQGQEIDLAGMTGWATGPHVHFEIRVNGTPINPAPYLPGG